MVDNHLIQDCKAGKRSAHQAIYNQCIAYVYSIIKRYIKDDSYRKDLVQESFAKIFTNINSYNGDKGSWNTWIRKITVNECLAFIRANKKLSILSPIDQVVEPSIDTTAILDQLTRKDIDIMLSDMPNGYKIVFMMYILDGYSHKEIGETLTISTETSRSQLMRGKNWIKKQFSTNSKYNAYGLF